jgi:pilus assembly protein CpaE
MKSGLPSSSRPLSLVAICLDRDSLGQLRNLIDLMPMAQLRSEFSHYFTESDDSMLVERAAIYVMDFDQDREKAIRTTERIHETFGQVPVFAVSQDPRPHQIISAMQCGCSEYLVKPLDHDKLMEAVARVGRRQRESQEHQTGQVLSFLGVKGGSGVTILATHLAVLLAKRHARKTLLVDNHRQLGDTSFYLALEKPKYHFHDLIDSADRLDADLLQGFLVRHRSGLDVLPSPDGFEASSQGSADVIERTLGFLRSLYEFILVDCPPGLDDRNLAVIKHSDRVYLVATPEIPSLSRVPHYLDCLDTCRYPADKVRLVVNRYSKKGIAEDQIEKATRIGVYWKVPNHYAAVVEAINTGAPASLSTNLEYVRNMTEWAKALADKRADAASKTTLTKTKAGIPPLSLRAAGGG